MPSIEGASQIGQLRLRYRVRSLEFMLAASAEEQGKLGKSMAELDGKLGEAFKRYEPLISSDEERKVYQDTIAAANAYKASVEQAVALRNGGKEAEALALSKGEWVKLANALRDHTDKLMALNHDIATDAAHTAYNSANLAKTSGPVALVVGLALAILLSVVMGRRISSRINEAISAAKSIAQGNLRSVLPQPSRDEIGELIQAMGSMQSQLHDAMQASRCAFDVDQTRTFQNVGARIEFICALAALSPSQQPHIKEALELATQLQVHSAEC